MHLYCLIFSLIPWKKKIKFFFFKSFLKVFFCDFFLFLWYLKKWWDISILKKKKLVLFNLLKSALRYKLHKHQLVLKKSFIYITGLNKRNGCPKYSFIVGYFLNTVLHNIYFLWGNVVTFNFQKIIFLNLKCNIF